MERPKNLTNSKTKNSVRIVILFHLVGLAGLSITAVQPLFLQLVPYHLVFMLVILCFNHQNIDTKFMVFFACIYIAGFMVEWVGVHTALLFGKYQYGKTLGLKLYGIPLTMGINWFLLIYATGTMLQHIPIKNLLLRILAGATGLVALDVLIEPAAIKYDYWHWQDAVVPMANYVCWFVISALLLLVFEICRFKKQTVIGAVLLVSQFLFFLGLLANTH
jgi:putative membrane protein